jgi:hypothetical protein
MPDKSPYDMSIDQFDADDTAATAAAAALASAHAQDDLDTPPRNAHSGGTPHQRVYQGESHTALPTHFYLDRQIVAMTGD